MKAIIFHGTECRPEDFWYPWLKKELEANGYEVAVPYYPDVNRTPIAEFLPKVLADHQFDEQTVLIGHSSGAPLILSILENIQTSVASVFTVAAFAAAIPGDGDPILQDSYNWEKIKTHAHRFVFINSDNDPWGCDDKQGKNLFDHLGGTLVIRHDGHFGSHAKNQPYKEFPLLKTLVLGRS